MSLFGIRIDAVTPAEAVDAFRQMIAARRPHVVFNVNVDICMQIVRDEELRRIYHAADLVLVDGTPMMWASRLLGAPLPARVSGSDFVPMVCAAAAKSRARIFLLGGRPGVAERAQAVLVARFPGLQIVGTDAPPFGFEHDRRESARVTDRIRAAAPDVLFVALGAPKEQRWLGRVKTELGVPVSMGIGSSLDYLAGRLRRAPYWMQRWGLEWTYRLVQEPDRLWRRYLLNDPPFASMLVREMIRSRRRNAGQRDRMGHADGPSRSLPR